VAAADLAFALELAELADSLSLPRFRASDLTVETKPDLSPVTDADRAVERALRERIAAERPGETVLGEEEGDDGGDVRWILDPIDGTRNFSRGLPVWATLIALERSGSVVCGVVSAPALGHRWWAARGDGAWRDGERIGVSRITTLAAAAASCSEGGDLALLESHVWHARGLGDFWQHMLVAEGALDAAVDTRLAVWDYAAVAIVVDEAGGRSGSPDGGGARPDEQLVSTNGLVHDEVLELLGRR
jgi:histidinol-phosphatase